MCRLMNHLSKIKTILFSASLAILLVIATGRPGWAADTPIVILTGANIEPYQAAAEGAKKALQGERFVVVSVDAEIEKIQHVMEKVSLLSPKAIIAIGSEAALAERIGSIDSPVVFCLVVDHDEWLKRPRSWAVSLHLSPEDSFHRIRQALPNKRIAIPYNPERTASFVKDLTGYFTKNNVELIPIVVRKPVELGPALIQARSKYDALWIIPDPSFIDPLSVTYIIEYSMVERIPIIGFSEAITQNGAILSVAGNYEDMGKQAAELALKVLSGQNPRRIAFPRKVQTYLNLRVAKLLDLNITDTLIAQADQLYPIDHKLRLK